MTNRFRVSAALLAAVAGGFAATANADVLMTLSYDDLAGSFTATAAQTGRFCAVAASTAALQSAGQVTRFGPGGGDAEFEAGFYAGNPSLHAADFQMCLDLTPHVGNPALVDALGNFVATDRDGDTITGDISGVWRQVGPFLSFSGTLTNVNTHDNGGADGSFDSTANFSGFSLSPSGPYDGAVVTLVFGANNLFRTSFSDRATNLNMQVLPTPGSVALLGLGGLAMVSRRRSR